MVETSTERGKPPKTGREASIFFFQNKSFANDNYKNIPFLGIFLRFNLFTMQV